MAEWSEEVLLKSIFKNWLVSSGLEITDDKKSENEVNAIKKWKFYFGGAPFKSLNQDRVEKLLYYLLGKIVLKMEGTENVHYGIVLPKNNVVERNVLNIKKETRKNLNLNFFLIDERQKIFHLSPAGERFREIENI